MLNFLCGQFILLFNLKGCLPTPNVIGTKD